MIKPKKRTKIVATLGPSSTSKTVITHLVEFGADVFRLNFSHGSAEDHQRRIELVRDVAATAGREVAILADLQGPKIRVARFKSQSVQLSVGAKFCLDTQYDKQAGDEHIVGVDYDNLPNDLTAGDKLLLDDGRIVLAVDIVSGSRIDCTVVEGGKLSDNKGINKLGGGLSADALTEKDLRDCQSIAQMDVDYVAVSFVRGPDDINRARKILTDLGSTGVGLVAKIERKEAINCIDEIINVSDAVMVARGDLGVEIGDAELPAVQKNIIGRARALDKVVITATQMMESMITSAIPTRAEVFDVANAVLDGTDAVMLSAETAAGNNPDKVVEAMTRICAGAERQKITQVSNHRLECHFEKVDEAVAMATMYTANHLDVTAIISLTESGATPLWMSRIRSGIPIFALSPHQSTLRKMALVRGVYPIYFDPESHEPMEINMDAIKALLDRNIVQVGDRVILSRGDCMGVHGSSNTMKIFTVGEVC